MIKLGNQTYTIILTSQVVRKDIPRLSEQNKKIIREAIRAKLSHAPYVFGKPLRRSLKGHRCLRIGNYRIIYRIENKTIIVIGIKHRSFAYN